MHTKSLTTRLFTTWLVWSKNKRNITYRYYWVFAIGITDYSTICWKLQQQKLPNPLTVDVIIWDYHFYIYQEITKIGAWVCNLRNCVLQHCYYSNITWASWYTNPLTTRLFAHSLFGLTNKDRVTGGISPQGFHNYAMCFHINTSPYAWYIFILWVFSWYQS